MSQHDDPKTRLKPGINEDEETHIIHENALRFSDDKTQHMSAPPHPCNADETKTSQTTWPLHAPRHQETPIAPGSIIKHRFHLVREIGSGGMGVVYAARDLRKEEVGDQDSIIAIKLLSDNLKAYPDALSMLQQECRKAQTLAHPNIVTVYDFDRDSDLVYMTMEYLTGQSLKEAIAKREIKRNSLSTVLPIITDIVRGLHYAHQQGIVHSDLKPANIHLTDKGVAKILDFGIARAVMESEAEKSHKRNTALNNQHDNPNSTNTELFALTPTYASLEMFEGAPPDPRDDIYALACITYLLLTGQTPFLSATDANEKHLAPKRVQGLTDREWQALQKGLALKRTDRTPSAALFLQSLLPKRREPWKLVAASLAFVAALATLFYVLKPPEIVEPSLFINPPPEAELSAAEQSEINEILEIAEVHMLVGRLISPPGGNALDKYNTALELHAYNRRAIKGLQQLLNKLAKQARQALNDADTTKAAQLINAGLEIDNKHKRLLALKQQLNQ
ncbi:MAG: serine/threonine protein kinase [Gammaproteobacteria bacterium]|nr:serine/threonine protein kinase [Gammaproteobacteria bacterium]